jgi:hypothetical protein
MIILSMNLRGFGGAPKMLSIKKVIQSTSPDIILFQETMVDSYKSKDFFLKCCPLWDCVAIDATGLSGGLISGWNPLSVDLQYFHTSVGILMEECLKGVSSTVKLLIKLLWSLSRHNFLLEITGGE